MFKSLFCCSHSKTETEYSELSVEPKNDPIVQDIVDPLPRDIEILIPEIQDSETSFTFQVDSVELCTEVPEMDSIEDILRKKVLATDIQLSREPPADFTGKIEDCSHRKDMNAEFISPYVAGMIAAIHTAYHEHYTLSLSVSDFIVLIGQGIGAHINKNPEKLRKYFVEHEGKEKITVERHDFVMGQQNDWSTVFGEFAEQIQKRVKADVYGVIIDDTSVATATSRIVSEITLMEAMKGYFDYDVMTKCGIPSITLEGKREDWGKLKDKVRKLVEMNKDDCLDLKWWLDELVPVVEKICEAGIERKIDKDFWSSIYKYKDMSGGAKIGGWIIKFFPCVSDSYQGGRNGFKSITTSMIPRQVCQVPFTWKYLGKDIPMTFSAGFLGAEFNKDLRQLKPALFWCVTKNEENEL